MLGDHREGTALATVRLDLATERPRYPRTRRRVSIQSGRKREVLKYVQRMNRDHRLDEPRDRRYQAFYRLDKSAWKRYPYVCMTGSPMICNLLPRSNL